MTNFVKTQGALWTSSENQRLANTEWGFQNCLLVLAEEASELSQAALKLVRVIDGKIPTKKTSEEAIDNLYEEIADVLMMIGSCFPNGMSDHTKADAAIAQKIEEKIVRFKQRREQFQKGEPIT